MQCQPKSSYGLGLRTRLVQSVGPVGPRCAVCACTTFARLLPHHLPPQMSGYQSLHHSQGSFRSPMRPRPLTRSCAVCPSPAAAGQDIAASDVPRPCAAGLLVTQLAAAEFSRSHAPRSQAPRSQASRSHAPTSHVLRCQAPRSQAPRCQGAALWVLRQRRRSSGTGLRGQSRAARGLSTFWDLMPASWTAQPQRRGLGRAELAATARDPRRWPLASASTGPIHAPRPHQVGRVGAECEWAGV